MNEGNFLARKFEPIKNSEEYGKKIASIFPELDAAEISIRAERLAEIIKKINSAKNQKISLLDLRRRGSDVEIWLSDGSELLATANLESYMKEPPVGFIAGNNETGHYLPPSSPGYRW